MNRNVYLNNPNLCSSDPGMVESFVGDVNPNGATNPSTNRFSSEYF